MSDTGPEVLLRVDGRAGVITLNRPRAINALSHAMVRAVDAALRDWERDPAVRTVVVEGAGERGLCAGGDIRAIHDDARAGTGAARDFWYDEYRLNARVARFPKPYVALMDGIVMGGGVGVSAHGSVRIVTERSRVAMPETGIGFVPDVGGTQLLARAPGELGTHLGLTGESMTASDALACGFADHFVPSAALPELLRDLARLPAEDAVARHAARAPAGTLTASRDWIDAGYAADSVEEIVERLRAAPGEGPRRAAEALGTRSPTALKVTLAALRRARGLGTLEAVLAQEYRTSCHALETADLVEGIRAQVIDKDRRPSWRPPTLAEVTPADVARFFSPLEGRELRLPPPTGAVG
ncbi:enoyl-CoA hydratase/isomerase family protein [Streptomyces profundus]|uniref:enoyl-CoA hydratase/isomerase family protein n=1 Tax=Streptomyces profundus TaxID=2867410 RepID=UPI001D16DD91|nr:enoyl-CoA hydratase/isomerase family protein [Streptomyces sp. MA3_2.13]UED86759.1 enoyl-CoA hydratase/isomerase family protein [Streptomyces sp. MA3_2.13]